MVYHSNNKYWVVSQKKSLDYYYAIDTTIQRTPGDRVNKIATSLRPIGPTILVEWEE